MEYNMFVDDERWPDKPNYLICRSSRDCILAVQYYGMPKFITFDHDLGGEDTSMVFIKWLENKLMDGELELPEGFGFAVHSQNPIGAENIRLSMLDLIKYF